MASKQTLYQELMIAILIYRKKITNTGTNTLSSK